MLSTRTRYAALAGLAAVLIATGTACNDTTGGSGKDTTASAAKSSTKSEAPSKSVVEEFTAYVNKNGTANEKAAVKHVTKIQGGDQNNDILDSADIYTDFKGDLMDSSATGSAKLLASAFADFQKGRGKASKNGLVTVYNASGDILGNGKF